MIYFFQFYKIDKLMYFNNLKSYNFNLNLIFLKKFYILNDFSDNKYNWSDVFYYNEDIEIRYLILKNSQSVNFNTDFKKNFSFYDKIKLKKKTFILKKYFDIDYVILNKVFSYKNNFDKNFLDNLNIIDDYDDINDNSYSKSIDLKRKLKSFIKTNRNISKSFFNLKYYRNYSISKNIKKLCNLKKNDFLFNLENNIINILLKTDFFFSKKDCIWFLKNGLISLNSLSVTNEKVVLQVNDVINIANSNFYYSFYKFNFDFLLNNIYKINLKLWSINNNRFKNVEKNVLKENYPSWIDDYKYFKKDIPLNLEVDYITMTIIFLNYNFNYKNLDYYNSKFISLYMNRSYNWKFII